MSLNHLFCGRRGVVLRAVHHYFLGPAFHLKFDNIAQFIPIAVAHQLKIWNLCDISAIKDLLWKYNKYQESHYALGKKFVQSSMGVLRFYYVYVCT